VCLMEESSWPVLEVTHEYLQNLVRKEYMTMAEFATCLVPMDLASPTLAKGFIMVCAAFYKRGFGAPPHRFFRSLLRSYGLELHHRSPSGILHIVIFVTLYEAYIGIEPPLNLWSHFFGSNCGRIQVWERRPWVV
jgi:hypothetical protein